MTDTLNMILEAKRPDDIFADLPGNFDHKLETGRVAYRRFAAVVHPDMNVGNEDKAEEAFKILNKMWEATQAAIEAETYGTDRAAFAEPIRVRSKRHAYKILGMTGMSDVCNVYRCEYDEGEAAILKVARSAADNDLVANEAKMLKHMLSNKETYDVFAPYLPGYIETFGYRVKGGKGKARQSNVFTDKFPNLFTLEQVRQKYPDGVHAKDMAWICRRILYCLGLTHANGVIHGSVFPGHILIQPEMHGLILVDWEHATLYEDPITSIDSTYKTWLPPEVLTKHNPVPGTDIFMAMRSMAYILGGDPLTGAIPARHPRQLKAFVKGCTQESVKRRPQNAADLEEEFNVLIENLYGPRKFRPFEM